MKKRIVWIIALALVCMLAFALVACNTTKNSAVAIFEFDENDGLKDFSMRRGILMQYKMDRLKSISGVNANWSTDKDGKIRLVAKNVGSNLHDVLEAINGEPDLEFRLSNTSTAEVVYKGRTAVTDASIGLGDPTDSLINLNFSKQGVDILNEYLGRDLYVYLNGTYCVTVRTDSLI